MMNKTDIINILTSGTKGEVREAESNLPKEQDAFRLHILRTCTVEAMAPYLKLAFGIWGRQLKLSFGNFGDIESHFHAQDIPSSDEKSEDSSPEPHDAIWVFWRLEDLNPRLCSSGRSTDHKERSSLSQQTLQRIEKVLHAAQETSPCPVLWSSVFSPDKCGHDIEQISLPHGPFFTAQTINQHLLKASHQCDRFQYFPLAEQLFKIGQFSDERMNLYGRIPLAAEHWGTLALSFADHLSPMLMPRRKVIAVDADNTLWGGVLGEEGPNNIQIGSDYPGNVYLELQHRLLELKSQGLLLVLLSKNDASSVEEAFELRDEMPLGLDDFIAVRCNYQDKANNLREIAQELRLGTNSFAFLDDLAYEQEQMKQMLPEVLVLCSSPDPLHLLESLRHAELAHPYQEKGERHSYYQQEKERTHLEKKSQSREEFLKSLDIRVKWEALSEKRVPRAAQLLQKTNQFNLCTRRHSEATLREWLGENRHHMSMIQVEDRFGDQGWVGLMIALKTDEGYELDSLLLSCRVIGRGVEGLLWNQFWKHCPQKLMATYVPTQRNGLVKDLLPQWGGRPIGTTEEGASQYTFDPKKVVLPSLDHLNWKNNG